MKNNRIGETNIAQNGLMMTIVEYRSAIDLDVKFSDGILVKNKTYACFKKGQIGNPNINLHKTSNIKDRTGESVLASNGEKMTIIVYRSSTDMDVQFQDGTIVKNVSYSNFKRGHVSNPNGKNAYSVLTANKHINESRVMNNNLKATIIAWRSQNDIDVQFEDGCIVYGKRYQYFKKGIIGHPFVNTKNESYKNSVLGERILQNCGLYAKVIEYNSASDLKIRFEDGVVVKCHSYYAFKTGSVGHPDKNPTRYNDRTSEKRVMNDGMSAQIIVYRNSHDIDVRFDNGIVVQHRDYNDFKNGSISCGGAGSKRVQRINTIKTMISGETVKCVAYRSAKDADFVFEDGTMVTNKEWRSFVEGKICRPKDYVMRVGALGIMHNGMHIECVEYNSYHDCKFRFEDGVVVTSNWDSFVNKTIAYPNRNTRAILYSKERIGVRKMQNCGMKAEVIAYRTSQDIDVRFEDGTLSQNMSWANFNRGVLSHPAKKQKKRISKNEFVVAQLFSPLNFSKGTSKIMKKYGFKGKELDLFCSDYHGHMVGIEYDGGQYNDSGKWHNKTIDTEKDKLCKKAGIHLIRIREPQLPILKSSKCFRLSSHKVMSDSLFDICSKIVEYLNKTFGCNDSLPILDKDALLSRINSLYYDEDDYVGERRRMHNGEFAKIIAYRNSTDIDIKFDDGTIRQNMSYYCFRDGKIGKGHKAVDNVGRIAKMKNGLYATIIKVRASNDIDVQFEDGTIVKHKQINSFNKGSIGIPGRYMTGKIVSK